uniref:Uncharacterized protein n=1 Tax=Rhizophora mucronata TaxID=61149 RepID=A0A2P2K3V2_RHIMU
MHSNDISRNSKKESSNNLPSLYASSNLDNTITGSVFTQKLAVYSYHQTATSNRF